MLIQDVASKDVCSLHLHLRYSQIVSPLYNSSQPKGPLSIKSAPLLIIAHGKIQYRILQHVLTLSLLGSVGKVRNHSGKDTKVYVSNDGGYTWKVNTLIY